MEAGALQLSFLPSVVSVVIFTCNDGPSSGDVESASGDSGKMPYAGPGRQRLSTTKWQRFAALCTPLFTWCSGSGALFAGSGFWLLSRSLEEAGI